MVEWLLTVFTSHKYHYFSLYQGYSVSVLSSRKMSWSVISSICNTSNILDYVHSHCSCSFRKVLKCSQYNKTGNKSYAFVAYSRNVLALKYRLGITKTVVCKKKLTEYNTTTPLYNGCLHNFQVNVSRIFRCPLYNEHGH